jgi:very-short-patch-repair endonuclease
MKTYSKEKFNSKAKIELPKPYICKICDKELKSIPGLASHLKNQHDGMPYREYLLDFYNIDVIAININWENTRGERKKNQLVGLKIYTDFLKGKPIQERLTPEEYKGFRENMKGVFSLNWYIQKLGEEEGTKKYKERSKQLSKNTFWREYNSRNSKNWSPVSQELFWGIYKRINFLYKDIYFGELNHEFSGGIPFCNFDFVINDNKKIIEFNGDKFHANPLKYGPTDIPLKFINKKAEEIWNDDKIKINKAKEKGYTVKIIWENEYRKNKEKIILECLDFLNNE